MILRFKPPLFGMFGKYELCGHTIFSSPVRRTESYSDTPGVSVSVSVSVSISVSVKMLKFFVCL